MVGSEHESTDGAHAEPWTCSLTSGLRRLRARERRSLGKGLLLPSPLVLGFQPRLFTEEQKPGKAALEPGQGALLPEFQ